MAGLGNEATTPRASWGRWWRRWSGCVIALLACLLVGCTVPQVSAESRLFLPLELELLDVITLPSQNVEETPVGGLSAITYDAQRDVFYLLSDDRGQLAPPRFYTARITLNTTQPERPQIGDCQMLGVTFLKDTTGNRYPANQLDPEGMVLSPRSTLLITSEGVASTNSPPALDEYDLATGRQVNRLRLPDRFLPQAASTATEAQGIRENLGFEALAIGPTSSAGIFEPFRLFLATESALAQDFDPDPAHPLTSRFLHYLIGMEQATLIAEHAYPLSLEPTGAVRHGLTELTAIDAGGHFLALERAYGLQGFTIKLWQLASGGASDTSARSQLRSLSGINPIQKQLLFDFATLSSSDLSINNIGNLEGMALGPTLPDGAVTLWLVSDDNFAPKPETQIWLFRLQST